VYIKIGELRHISVQDILCKKNNFRTYVYYLGHAR